MKNLLLSFLAVLATVTVYSQVSFTDDFEAYTNGSYLAKSDPAHWKTWKNAPGTAEDVKINNTKAHSGTNSIYFMSTATGGGPTDILLPFGGLYSTGSFTMEMWVYIETGKTAYFNFQANTTPGQRWTLETHFNSDGKFDIVNTDDGTLLTGSFTQNKWIDIKLTGNLSSGNWDFQIDGNSVGKFSNSITAVASMDLFAIAGSSFWVDDVSYNYTPYVLPNLNGAVVKIGNMLNMLAGRNTIPSVTIRNVGKTAINSVDLTLDYNSNTFHKIQTGLNIQSLDTLTIKFDGPAIAIAGGKHNAVATLNKVNDQADEDATDNTFTLSIDPIVPAPNRVVVAEEKTGTWCQWCPRGAVYMDLMTDKYPGYFAGIAVHNGDPMTNIYDAGFAQINGNGYPNVSVDRMAGVDPLAMEADFMKRIVTPAKMTFKNGAKIDDATGELKVSVTTTFTDAANAGYKIACVLTEDNVTGTATTPGYGYRQVNAYSGGANGVMGGFEKLPSPVPANKMVYNHVARAIAPYVFGLGNAFPGTITSGTKFTHDFTFDISGYNKSNLHIIAFVIAPNGQIENAATVTFDQAVTNGYEVGTQVTGVKELTGPDQISIYPNPASNNLNITNAVPGSIVNIIDASGKVVRNTAVEAGIVNINVSDLHNGLYIVKIFSEDNVTVKKVIINK